MAHRNVSVDRSLLYKKRKHRDRSMNNFDGCFYFNIEADEEHHSALDKRDFEIWKR